MDQNFIISLAVSLPIALYFFIRQWRFHSATMKNLKLFNDFFKKTSEYETIDANEDSDYLRNGSKNFSSKRLKNVAANGAELHALIEDINEYLESCKGTATFNIIQNKTERRITKLYDKTASKASLPTHLGLMGTFVGVFLGLGAFLWISMNSPEGITDSAIHSLILGVLVSMSTSFVGLLMSTKAHDSISNAKNKNDDDKNEFYEYIQNKLMPSVDISLTEALGNLHQTVSDFEPSFSKVIDGFKATFKECTNAFGEDFRRSVQGMVDAVGKMSGNINKITENVYLLEELLTRVSGAEWMRYMRQFADASDHFEKLTHSLNDFERARRMMIAAVQESINMQKEYSESLTIPREVATQINTILQRVVRFEQNINALGDNLAATQMLGNTEIEEIKNQISAIKVKHKVAEQYIETSNNKLEMFFDSQLIELKRLEEKYEEALENLFKEYEKLTIKHQEEIGQRHERFKEAIDEKFELSEVQSELEQLKKIPSLENKLDDVKRGQDKLQRTNDGIRKELNAFNAAKEENEKGIMGRIMNTGGNTANKREIARQDEIIRQQQEEIDILRRKDDLSLTGHSNVQSTYGTASNNQSPAPHTASIKQLEQIRQEQKEKNDNQQPIGGLNNKEELEQEESKNKSVLGVIKGWLAKK